MLHYKHSLFAELNTVRQPVASSLGAGTTQLHVTATPTPLVSGTCYALDCHHLLSLQYAIRDLSQPKSLHHFSSAANFKAPLRALGTLSWITAPSSRTFRSSCRDEDPSGRPRAPNSASDCPAVILAWRLSCAHSCGGGLSRGACHRAYGVPKAKVACVASRVRTCAHAPANMRPSKRS